MADNIISVAGIDVSSVRNNWLFYNELRRKARRKHDALGVPGITASFIDTKPCGIEQPMAAIEVG